MGPYILVFQTNQPDEVGAVQRALDDQRIPYPSAWLASQPPSVAFTVPEARVVEARQVVATCLAAVSAARWEEEDLEDSVPDAVTRFPGRQLMAVGCVLLLHLALVLVGLVSPPAGRRMIEAGALVGRATPEEPWRLATYMFLHSDLSHALWNGVSMIVFAVPLLLGLGHARTLAIYLAAGIGGGLSASMFAEAGRFVIGSSGAVAGLYGAWVILALRDAQRHALTWRASIRILGIAMLVLPSLVSPVSSTGRPISVSGHLGGMATGMLIGAFLGAGTVYLGGARRPASAAAAGPRELQP